MNEVEARLLLAAVMLTALGAGVAIGSFWSLFASRHQR